MAWGGAKHLGKTIVYSIPPVAVGRQLYHTGLLLRTAARHAQGGDHDLAANALLELPQQIAEAAGAPLFALAALPATIDVAVNSPDPEQAGAAAIQAIEQVATVAVAVAGAVKVAGQPQAALQYKRPNGATTPAQRAYVQGKPCVDCGALTPRQIADHKTPLVKEHYETGTIDKARMRSLDAVQPQCPSCSNKQGSEMSRYSRVMKDKLGQ